MVGIFCFNAMAYLVYILYSEKLNKFYVGFTSDFEVRLEFHLQGDDLSRFTRRATDWKLYLQLACKSKEQAMKVELHIKSMKSSTYIRNLKQYPELVSKLLECFADVT